jgi:hypothetical protein
MHNIRTEEHKKEVMEKTSKTAKKNYASGQRTTWNKGLEWSDEVKQKLSLAHKLSGHQPIVRGGNGKISECEKMMREILPSEWIMQCAIPTKMGRTSGYPTCYKVDFGIPQKKIALEVDGNSHRSRKRLDEKKDTFLQSLGWTVLRISNNRAQEMYSIYKLTGSMIILPTEF